MISFVVVTYNSEKVIERCLNSLAKNIGNGEAAEIVIVDNYSVDGTRKIVEAVKKKTRVDIKLLPQGENTGFVKGCNLGAAESGGDWLVFLNPDTEALTPNLIKKLSACFEPREIVGFHFLNPGGTLQPSAGRFPTLSRIICDRLPVLKNFFGLLVRNKRFYRQRRVADWVSGSGFIVAKSIFDKIGGFDENIFMYGEDIDFCYRAKKNGCKIIYDPTLSFVHNDTGSRAAERKPHKYFFMRLGLAYFYGKHYSLIFKRLLLLITKLEACLRISWMRMSNPENFSRWENFLRKTIQIK